MIKIAKDYNEKLHEDDEEEQEIIKDMIQDAQTKILTTIRNETGALQDHLIESKRMKEDEFNRLDQRHEDYFRELEEEKHIGQQIMTQNDVSPLMQNFESEIKEIFKEVYSRLEKDEDEERRKDENFIKIEQNHLNKIQEKNDKINELKSYRDELKRL